jgi:hypothetical protein
MKRCCWLLGLVGLALTAACAPNEVVPNTTVDKPLHQLECMAGCQVYTDDPNPDSVGVWMSDYFTAANCYGGAYDDNDYDGIGDQCEWALAKRFAPILITDSSFSDNIGGERYWAARPEGSDSTIWIVYFPAYYVDLGCYVGIACDFDGGHAGDSEAFGLELKWHPGSQHWVVIAAKMSEHHTYNNYSGSPYATGLEYPTELGGPFNVHVSWGKHANYATRYACNHGDPEDYCGNASSSGDTLYVGLERNLGSAGHPLHDCVLSSIPYGTYQECFWTGSNFLGWNSGPGSDASYIWRLLDFEFLY